MSAPLVILVLLALPSCQGMSFPSLPGSIEHSEIEPVRIPIPQMPHRVPKPTVPIPRPQEFIPHPPELHAPSNVASQGLPFQAEMPLREQPIKGPVPPGRWMHASTQSGGDMYVFGGLSAYHPTHFNDVWQLKYADRSWSRFQESFVPPTSATSGLNPELFGINSVIANLSRPDSIPAPPMLSVPVGHAPPATLSNLTFVTADLWKYDMNLQLWQFITPSNTVPPPRYGHTITAFGKHLVLFGGANSQGQLLSDAWVFDLDKKTWTNVLKDRNPFIMGRVGHCAFPQGSNLIIFGGSSFGGVPFNDVVSYDVAAGRVSEVTIMSKSKPLPRWLHTCDMLDASKIVVFGGLSPHSVPLDDLWILDLTMKSWISPKPRQAKPVPRMMHVSGISPSRKTLYVWGGSSLKLALDDMWACTLSSKGIFLNSMCCILTLYRENLVLYLE